MHQRYPDQQGFPASEIIAEAKNANLAGRYRPGVAVHTHLHNVANLSPNPARYRMLFKLPNGDLRLFRPADAAHPDRNGKITPDPEQLPAEFHRHLDWYQNVYCAKSRSSPAAGPNLSPKTFIDRLSGLGKEVWRGVSGDEYVSELRKGWD